MVIDNSIISIRKARQKDAEDTLACLREAFEVYRGLYTPDAFRDTVPTLEGVQKRIAEMCVFVAASPSDEIAGTISCHVLSPEEGHIRGMAVRTAWHGVGVAEDLIRAAESELRDQSCARVSLDTTAHLQRAIRFYEKQGFQRSGKIADFFGMELIEFVKVLRAPEQV